MPFPPRCTMSLLLASCLGIISALAPLLAADPALILKQTAIIVEQRGRVRGVGMLARYPAPGPQLIAVSRTTTALAGEAFTPFCTVRVLDPTGRTVAWQELTDQPDGPLMARLKVPAGPAGIWRVSV